MKKLLLAAACLAVVASPASAKNFAFPKNNPSATVTIPDNWPTEEIDYGFSAKSPDDDVFFSVESAEGKNVDKMMQLNNSWMADNKIKPRGNSTKTETKINGIDATVVSMPATDANGETNVDFVFMPAPNDRVIMITLWASEAEAKNHAAEITAIQRSIKPIQ